MKPFKFLLVALLAVVLFSSCERVGPNEQGVLMSDYGKSGKADFTLQKGQVWTLMPGTELFTVPLWEQRGDFGDRILHLKSADNTEFTSRPMYSFRVIGDRAIDVVFDNKQATDANKEQSASTDFMVLLSDNVLEPAIYDLIKEESRKNKTEVLMADGGSLAFENRLQEIVKASFLKKGLELISFSAQLEFTAAVTEKIDKRNSVNTNLTVLDQEIIQQKKKNELEELVTQQNLIRTRGLTPQILQEKWIDAWKETKQPLYGNNPLTLMLK